MSNEHPTPVRYTPGHVMHFIHANHVGARPWGWRDGVIRSSHDGHHVVDYTFEAGSGWNWE